MAGVPTAVQIERKAAIIRVAGVTSMPAAVPIKVMAHICIAVVPFILIVMPVGRTKEEISSEQPSSSIQVLVFKGNVAAEELQAAAKIPTFATFFMNLTGFNPVVKKIPMG